MPTARKTTRLASHPRSVVLALSRFRYDTAASRGRKVDTELDVRETLLLGGVAYDLYAVVVHAGASPHHGHYYAVGRDSGTAGSRWRLFDDAVVRDVGPAEAVEHVRGASPYILFYARADDAAGADAAWRPDIAAYVENDNARLAEGRPPESRPAAAAAPPPPPSAAEPFAGGGATLGGAGSWGVS